MESTDPRLRSGSTPKLAFRPSRAVVWEFNMVTQSAPWEFFFAKISRLLGHPGRNAEFHLQTNVAFCSQHNLSSPKTASATGVFLSTPLTVSWKKQSRPRGNAGEHQQEPTPPSRHSAPISSSPCCPAAGQAWSPISQTVIMFYLDHISRLCDSRWSDKKNKTLAYSSSDWQYISEPRRRHVSRRRQRWRRRLPGVRDDPVYARRGEHRYLRLLIWARRRWKAARAEQDVDQFSFHIKSLCNKLESSTQAPEMVLHLFFPERKNTTFETDKKLKIKKTTFSSREKLWVAV